MTKDIFQIIDGGLADPKAPIARPEGNPNPVPMNSGSIGIPTAGGERKTMTAADIRHEGSALLAMLMARASELGLSERQVATEYLGVHPSYLGQLRSSEKHGENISRQFAESCARFLGIPVMAVLVASGQLREEDFREVGDDTHAVQAALDYMQRDPVVGPFLPRFAFQADPGLQKFMVLLYERATGLSFLRGRLAASEMIGFAKIVPSSFRGKRRS